MDLPTESEVTREFGKQEILSLCRELEIEVDDAEHVYALVDLIWKDLDAKGIPMAEDASDLLWEFLVFCRYYDGEGKIIDPPEEGQKEDSSQVIAKISDNQDEPKCFGWGEPEYNPNCKRCPWKDLCVEKREEETAQMSCFSVLYDAEHKECKDCTIWRTCKDRQEARRQ